MEPERDLKTLDGPRRQLVVLVRLQRLDRERDVHERLISQTEPIIRAREKSLHDARELTKASYENLKHAKAKAHDAEVDLKANAERIQKLELQLNTAKTNQEFHALQSHINKLKSEAAAEEDSTLVLYDEIEHKENLVRRAEEKVKTLTAEFETFKKTCENDRDEAQKDLEETAERRQMLLAELPPDMRAEYERVRKARDGVAIVPCEDRTCSGCGFSVTPNDHARMMAASQIVHCDSCQRILYVPEALKAFPDG